EGRLADAALRYEEAYQDAVRVGVRADPERARAVAGVVTTRLQLAHTGQRQGFITEAVAHVDRVLRVDPLNQEAARLKQELERTLARRQGMVPSADTIGQVPEMRNIDIQVNTLVQ